MNDKSAWQASWYRLAVTTPTIADNTTLKGLLNSQEANLSLLPHRLSKQGHLAGGCSSQDWSHSHRRGNSWAHWDGPGRHTH